jgi:hypothetical protein
VPSEIAASFASVGKGRIDQGNSRAVKATIFLLSCQSFALLLVNLHEAELDKDKTIKEKNRTRILIERKHHFSQYPVATSMIL